MSRARISSERAAVDAAKAADTATRTGSLLMSTPFWLREILMARLVALRFFPHALRTVLHPSLFHGSPARLFRSVQALPGHRQVHQRQRRAARHAVRIAKRLGHLEMVVPRADDVLHRLARPAHRSDKIAA